MADRVRRRSHRRCLCLAARHAELPNLQAGDRVRLRGVTGAGDFAPVVQSPQLQFVEHAGFPAAHAYAG